MSLLPPTLFTDYEGSTLLSDEGSEDPTYILPSARLWAGHPKYAYVWFDFLAGPATPGDLPIYAGLGHASETVRAELGFGGRDNISLQGQYRWLDKIWLGSRLHVNTELEQYGGMVMLTVTP